MKNNKIKITQIKSPIGYKKNAKETLIALGLRKNNQSIIKEDSPSIRGMIKSIEFMLRIEEL
ncbi:MAG: 50S ribosomal protein L30 [bacterium TMED198]|nr:MAG: 50S ribosomal protein L30 [bacterium TMED198]